MQACAEQGISSVKVVGDMNIEDRQRSVDEFQAGRARVFVGTYGAAGVGLTLTASSDTLHVERDWTPSIEEQAEDRCHRIGQTESVTSWYLVSGASIDEKFDSMVDAKRGTIKSILGGDGQVSESLVMELAEEIFGG
jgi:SWI/SNF-related matrix-associated actin-dependent regulator of chromatin subfamily A-like protein 1